MTMKWMSVLLMILVMPSVGLAQDSREMESGSHEAENCVNGDCNKHMTDVQKGIETAAKRAYARKIAAQLLDGTGTPVLETQKPDPKATK